MVTHSKQCTDFTLMHAFLYDIKVVTTSNVKIVLDIIQKNIYLRKYLSESRFRNPHCLKAGRQKCWVSGGHDVIKRVFIELVCIFHWYYFDTLFLFSLSLLLLLQIRPAFVNRSSTKVVYSNSWLYHIITEKLLCKVHYCLCYWGAAYLYPDWSRVIYKYIYLFYWP